MTWEDIVTEIVAQEGYVPYIHPKALEELEEMLETNLSSGKLVAAAIIRLCKNPLPKDMGGVGSRLGKRKETGDLRPIFYVKLKGTGIRIVYALSYVTDDKHETRASKTVTIVVINKREDMEAYLEALKRKPGLFAEWLEKWAQEKG